MAKRFTDTGIGRKAWFRKLSPKMKCVWRFLCDECESDGVFSIDEEALEFYLGDAVSLQEILSAFNCDGETRIKQIGINKIWITGFIAFQYGELSEQCKPHCKVISDLKKHSLWKEYVKGFQTLEDKEEDKEEEKEGGVGENPHKQKLDFNAIYQKYPLKEGKAKGIEKCKAQIKNHDDYVLLAKAIDAYKLKKKGVEPKFLQHFSTFMENGAWRDWLDPETGTSESAKPKTTAERMAEFEAQKAKSA